MGIMGLESFKNKFKGYEDCYTIIGGTACDILMQRASLDFRATKDIDMIILFEDRFQDFAHAFWEYIKEGGYRCGWKNSDDVHFYRFTDPKPGYPVQIELFSRKPDYHLETLNQIIPVYIDDDTSSLSAILLNDDFYNFMLNGRVSVDGVSVLEAEYIRPFKMYAWNNLKERKENGEHVNERDLRKHKYDVFRLLRLVPEGQKIYTDGDVKSAIESFIKAMGEEELALDSIGLEFSKEDAIDMLRNIYG